MNCNRNRKTSGCNMHSWMKLCQYKLRIHPSSWHRANMVRSVVDRMQRIKKHACHWAHASNPTHSTQSPRQRQEASPIGAEHALQKFDAHNHQHTLEDRHGYYASVCFQSNHTMRMLVDDLDEGAEPMHRLQWRQEFASEICRENFRG